MNTLIYYKFRHKFRLGRNSEKPLYSGLNGIFLKVAPFRHIYTLFFIHYMFYC